MKQFKCILFVAYENIKKVCGVFFIFQSWQYQQNLRSKEKTATKCVIITRRITIKPAYGYILNNTDFLARWTEKYYECCLRTKL